MSDGLADLARGIRGGNRRALARGITLIESGRADHRAEAAQLLSLLGTEKQALRVGLSGTPGVGKSTFIEALGLHLTETGKRVAVLAVDPSSTRSGGSILGDKTRMEHLSRDPRAFIRPSPSQSHLGGVARRTREAVTLCEAAGFDVVLIETVGVGQSETMVADMSDIFLLLLAPAGGDELQGVKRGIMETADIVLINKADGDLQSQAMRTVADYTGALRLMRKRAQDPDNFPKVLPVSAVTGTGLSKAWAAVTELRDWRVQNGVWDARRIEQAKTWFGRELHSEILTHLTRDPTWKQRLATLEADVLAGRNTPAAAALEAVRPLTGPQSS